VVHQSQGRILERDILELFANASQPDNDYVNIGNPGENATEHPLDAFQRRLIYQLVRKEFPDLRTFPRNNQTFMRVEKVDVKREEEVRDQCLRIYATL